MKIKVLNLPNGDKRIISGKLLDQFDLDYTQEMSKLKRDIEFALSVLERNQSSLENLFTFANKNVRVYQGGHHLDIIDDGVGSLGWLTVEDHWHGLLSSLAELTDEDKKDLDEMFPSKQTETSYSHVEKQHA